MGLRSLATVLSLLPLFLAVAASPVQDDGVLASPTPSSQIGTTVTLTGSTLISLSAPSPSASATTSIVGTVSASTLASSSSTSSVLASSTPVPPPSQTHYTFTPFPTPTQQSVPGVFPETDPSNPPPVGSSVVPDFNPAWARAYAKAKAKVATFTLEQKVNVTTGVGWALDRCVGNIPPVPIDGSGFPGLCLEDSPLGVRFADFVTAFPAAINAAATWDRQLIRRRGVAMGKEHVGKGVHIALGPMMNLGRVAQGGRNWEGFGADPFLAGEGAYETILGMQKAGVQACAKHLVNNEQEHFRTTSSSNVDDRTQHEVYAHPFLRSVMAGATSIMCSYNLINNTYACENSPILNDLVKKEYGFQGFIMSDWAATHSTLSAVAGLDMTMPGDITFNSGDSWFGGNLTAFVKNGIIPEARVDDMATRILAGWYLLKQDSPSYPKVNFNAFLPLDQATNGHVDVQDDHFKLVREMGAASVVMLKNVDGALPLRQPRSLFVAGNDAGPARAGPNGFPDHGGSDGVLAMGWGSGTAWFPYLISPLEAIQRRARQDRTSVSWALDNWNLATAGAAAVQGDAAIVFINSDSGEEYITVDGNMGDRNNLTAWHNGDNLVLAVAKNNENTIVVVHSVGPLIVEPWIDHPNVTAVLWAGLPGQEAGNSIVDVLYGDWNPSAKLPYTIAKKVEDYSAQLVTTGTAPVVQIDYDDGLQIDYRWFDAKNITPRFEFGFGLSYTNFKYANLKISKVSGSEGAEAGLVAAWEKGRAAPFGQGSSTALWLHRPAYTVSFDVKNTGSVYGAEVAQLYLNHPPSTGEPPAILRGFDSVKIQPGQSERVTVNLSRYDLSVWDTVQRGWVRPKGAIGVGVGASSRDWRLYGKIGY